jgi:hypothetical protein
MDFNEGGGNRRIGCGGEGVMMVGMDGIRLELTERRRIVIRQWCRCKNGVVRRERGVERRKWRAPDVGYDDWG